MVSFSRSRFSASASLSASSCDFERRFSIATASLAFKSDSMASPRSSFTLDCSNASLRLAISFLCARFSSRRPPFSAVSRATDSSATLRASLAIDNSDCNSPCLSVSSLTLSATASSIPPARSLPSTDVTRILLIRLLFSRMYCSFSARNSPSCLSRSFTRSTKARFCRSALSCCLRESLLSSSFFRDCLRKESNSDIKPFRSLSHRASQRRLASTASCSIYSCIEESSAL